MDGEMELLANYSDEYLKSLSVTDLESLLRYEYYPSSKSMWREDITLWELALKLGFYIPIFLVAIICNGLVLIVLLKKKSMRNVTHMFLINLAISDVLVTLFGPWIHIVQDLSERWLLGAFICKFEPFMQGKNHLVWNMNQPFLSVTEIGMLTSLMTSCHRYFY